MTRNMDPLARFHLEWSPIPSKHGTRFKLDVFKHNLSAADGLPPYAQARIIDLISHQLGKTRPTACLWVSVESPGNWFVEEIRRLVKFRIPTAVLPSTEIPFDDWDFRPHAEYHLEEYLPSPVTLAPFSPERHGLNERTLRTLRVLARLKTGHTREIASLAGFSPTHIRRLLKQLRALDLIAHKQIGKYQGWEILTKGMRVAHRSWNIPKGAHFAPHRREFRYSGERHRRVSRLWRAWLEKAYPYVEIWDCWTEVSIHFGIPDALAWGKKYDREYLFWLEVDSGHSSRKTMRSHYQYRLRNAYEHSLDWGIPILFCIMGPPWVVREFPGSIPLQFPDMAIIGHDWRDFGRLPIFERGRWIQDLDASAHKRRAASAPTLPFDPGKYSPRPEFRKDPAHLKQRSNKPRYVDHASLDRDREWDPNDR